MTAYYNEFDPRAAAWLRELISAGLIAPGDVDTRSIKEVSPHELTGYKQQHFFAGIGGWSLALRLAGWPDSQPVRTGSCPCQPFSQAGKGKGEADERHLWPVFRDLITFGAPTVTFGEQVASAAGRQWLARVRLDLEGLGYRVGAADLCAASVGAPHIRQRLFWVADPDGRKSGNGRIQRGRKHRLESEDRGSGRMADARHESTRGSARSCEAEGRRSFGDSSGCGNAGGMGDADGSGFGEQRRTEPIPEEQSAAQLRGDACNQGMEHAPSDGRKQRRPESIGGSVASGCGLGFWSAFDLLPCTDGKSRRIEPGSFSMVDGVSPAMDDLWNACLWEIETEIETYATTTKTHPKEIMREMRKGISPAAFQRTVGGSDRLSEAALLFAALCELSRKLGRVDHRQTPAISEEQKAGLRKVWESVPREVGAACPPPGPRHAQQLADKLRNAVRKLPPEAAQYFFNGFPLIGKMFGRMGLLRGYGNAIVPQVGAEFIKAYLES